MNHRIEIVKEDETKMFRGYKTAFRRAIAATLKKECFSDRAEVSVTLVTPEAIQDLNREYRGVDRETDVLSFPLWEKGEVPEKIGKTVPLGDVIVCPRVILNQAKEFQTTPQQEFCLMVIHSTLHLLGWDHTEEKEKEEMFALQEAILSSLELGQIRTEAERKG